MFQMNWVILVCFVPQSCLKSTYCKSFDNLFIETEIKLPHWVGHSKIHMENMTSTMDYFYECCHNSSSYYETDIDLSGVTK